MIIISQLRRASRRKAKLKLGLAAPSGGGKTLGSLLIAYGLMLEKYPDATEDERWSKIAIIDTENGSGELYVGLTIDGLKIGEYFTIPVTPPFTPKKYIEGIKTCHSEGIEVCILDSASHAWAGQGGLLEQQGNVAKRTGNSYTAWRDVTPLHNQFVDTMLQTDIHIIVTMRSKTEYVIEKDSNGKSSVRKVGLAPIQRDGMEYEFTAFFDIDAEHNAYGSKDRTTIFDQQYFKISPETGRQLMRWLETGEDVRVTNAPPSIKKAEAAPAEEEKNGSKNNMLEVPDLEFEEFKSLLTVLCQEKSKDKSIGSKKVREVINAVLDGGTIADTTEFDFDEIKELYKQILTL
ncbi:AAA family ATPase [Paenibacillus xylaniclasticus]|uniref:AAA family ATPase n=1 Tax=Paenibacillus xylaniclasticus TaxID=588083 RepID=UPI000FD9F221|nr:MULTISPECIES: AAA family ATPase [Paenibacillus]GFN32499.1 hypothetical protein PCURB6_27590 [Paenibacillus curdlanolyticus]